jgi:ribosome-associated protein
MQTETMREEILRALQDAKGQDIKVLDVRGVTDFTDYMVIVTGTSSRHAQTLADRLREHMRACGVRPVGTEGEKTGDWVLIDFGDVVVHVMRAQVRDFYNLEKLWSDAKPVDLAKAAKPKRAAPRRRPAKAAAP